MYLCDGKVQAYIDDDSEEQNVEGPHHQQGLLQHQDLIKVIMDLKRGKTQELDVALYNYEALFGVIHYNNSVKIK